MLFRAKGRAVIPRLTVALAGALFLAAQTAAAQFPGKAKEKAPAQVMKRIAAGQPQNLIVVFDDQPVRRDAALMQSMRALPSAHREVIEYKAARYAEKKQRILSTFSANETEVLKSYSHLPLAFVRIRSRRALEKLLARPEVAGVYEDRKDRRMLAQSLPLTGQPEAAAQGYLGAGATVAVLDTGVDYTRAAFGSCAAPGVPAACKVVFAQDFAPDDGKPDDDGHGTNVAGIVLGVAPGARIAALDVFRDDGFSYFSDQIAAMNWVIANKTAYNIVAMNMSLGGGAYTSPVTDDPRKTAIDSARAAGILTVAAAGNEGLTSGLAAPAAIEGVVSVGAVYDSDIGGISGSVCTDATTAADQVACFSNSASFLTLLAPGARITAAELTGSGTSQATPHVAGAVAVLRAAFPADTPDQTVARLTRGVPVGDSRNNIIKPRLHLPSALGMPVSCSFAISPTSRLHGGGGATGNIAVGASSPDCGWVAVSTVSWITVTAGASGTGAGTVTYALAPNPDASPRTGRLFAAGIIFTVTQASQVEIFPANGAIPAGWATPAGANAGWMVANDTASEGSLSLKSNRVDHAQKAQIEITRGFAAGTVSFSRKVSSEQFWDHLRFYIDGVQQAQWSGEQDWATVSFPITEGAHTLRWSYEKDINISSGSDAAWIDAVSLPGSAPQSGWWWDPATGGRGFAIEIRNGRLFMGAFLYDESGRATWYVSTGAMNGMNYTGPLLAFSGGQTLTGEHRQNTPQPSPGEISIQFSDDRNGTLTWPGGTFPIRRFDIVQNGVNASRSYLQPETGWWWNAAEPGRGFMLEIQNQNIFLAGFMYDGSGNPVWHLTSGALIATDPYIHNGTWAQYGNGQTLTGPYRAPTVVNSNVGGITLQFSFPPTTALLTLPDGRQITLTRFSF